MKSRVKRDGMRNQSPEKQQETIRETICEITKKDFMFQALRKVWMAENVGDAEAIMFTPQQIEETIAYFFAMGATRDKAAQDFMDEEEGRN